MDDFLGRNDEQMQCRGILHIVEAGDTLYKIGKKYGVPVSRVMYANPYVNVYNLQIGDEICVPVMVPRMPSGADGMPEQPAMRNDRVKAKEPAMPQDYRNVREPAMRQDCMGVNGPAMCNDRMGVNGPAMRNDRMAAGQPVMRNHRADVQGPAMQDRMETREPVMQDHMDRSEPAMQDPYMGTRTYGNTQPPLDPYFRQHAVPVQDYNVQRYMTPAREKNSADPMPAAESWQNSMGGMSYEGSMGFSREPAEDQQDSSVPQTEGADYMGNCGADIQEPDRNDMGEPGEAAEEPGSKKMQEASGESVSEMSLL